MPKTILIDLEHAQVPPTSVIGYAGGWEWCLLALDDETTGTKRYADSLEAHEAAAHAVWQTIPTDSASGAE